MNYLGQLFSSAKKYYQNINAATLTGAIDVIVIEQENGDYKSTPFYVRFGKLGVLCPQTHSVEVCINGKPVPDLRMYIELTGDALFELTKPTSQQDTSAIVDENNEEPIKIQTCSDQKQVSSLDDGNAGPDFNISSQDSSLHDGKSTEQVELQHAKSTNPTQTTNSIPVQSALNDKLCLRDLVNLMDKSFGLSANFHLYMVTRKPSSDPNPNDPNELAKPDHGNAPTQPGQHCDPNVQTFPIPPVQPLGTDVNPTTPITVSPDHLCDFDCHLIMPDDSLLVLDTPIDQLDDIWCVWSGHCMPLRMTLTWFGENLTQMEKDQLSNQAASKPQYQIVQHTHHHLVDADSGLDNPSPGHHSPESVSVAEQKSSGKRRGFWSWWRRTADAASNMNVQPEGEVRVQKVLPPIDLIVSSPDGSSDEEHGPSQTDKSLKSRWFGSETDDHLLLQKPTPINKPSHSSTTDLTQQSVAPTQQPESDESHGLADDRGYLSDQESRDAVMHASWRLSKHVKERMACQGTRNLDSEQLKRLNLHSGPNEAVFTVVTQYQGTCQCACFIYLWKWTDKIVVSDIDGTITKSDWLGHLMPLVGCDWTHPHIVQLYDRVARNGYRLIYVSSRPIGQARSTRKLLRSAQHKNKYHLPDGPILLYPFSAIEAFHKEVILRRADEYKIKCLLEVCQLFESPDQQTIPDRDPYPLVAGFGNRPTDVNTYKTVGLKNHQIFTVNYQGQVIQGDPQLGQKSDKAQQTASPDPTTQEQRGHRRRESLVRDLLVTLNPESLLQMTDAYFPQLKDRMVYASTCSDFTFWR